MPKPLRQSIELPIGEGSIALEVTFRILEIVERHYDLRAEFVGKFILENDARIKRSDVAKIIMAWLDVIGEKSDREEVFEAVLTASDEKLRKYVGAIQGAIFYSLREITADELKALARGEDIRQAEPGEDDGKKNNTTND